MLVGVNLLREGLDIPSVSLVAILDADKEGFLRSERSLTQTAGRAARNINGQVIMYADVVTKSMQMTIDETNHRRHKQEAYNKANGIIPQQVGTKLGYAVAGKGASHYEQQREREASFLLQDPVIQGMSPKQLKVAMESAKKRMEEAAEALDFMTAAKARDEMNSIKLLLKDKE